MLNEAHFSFCDCTLGFKNWHCLLTLFGFPSQHPDSRRLAGESACRWGHRSSLALVSEGSAGDDQGGKRDGGVLHHRGCLVPSSRLRCKPKTVATADPLPLMYDTTDGRQPVDTERVLRLPRDHGRDRDGCRLLALAPALVHQVQVAMHPGHLVGREGVGAVIIWGKRGGRDWPAGPGNVLPS